MNMDIHTYMFTRARRLRQSGRGAADDTSQHSQQIQLSLTVKL